MSAFITVIISLYLYIKIVFKFGTKEQYAERKIFISKLIII